jgi:protein-tyrosine phosphatase
VDRNLAWEGCFNVRDLGGLPTVDGRRIRRGALVRSDAPDGLTDVGWAALREHGVRTIVDLRNQDERAAVGAVDGLDVMHLPVDPVDDLEFWPHWGQGINGVTPLYYRPLLDRHPRRLARVVVAVARARPGGVLVHCAFGRDRTGLVVMLLLALAGVPVAAIADDYEISMDRMSVWHAALGQEDWEPRIAAELAARGTTSREVFLATLDSFDVEGHLRAGGLPDTDLTALRSRLIGPAPVS